MSRSNTETTAGCCSPLEHSKNSPLQKCGFPRRTSGDDVHPTPTTVGSTLKKYPNRRYRHAGRNAYRENRIPVIILCLTFVALSWQKTVFIHPPLQRKPLSFTCFYGLTYVPILNNHKLFYWIK